MKKSAVFCRAEGRPALFERTWSRLAPNPPRVGEGSLGFIHADVVTFPKMPGVVLVPVELDQSAALW